jgi:hypothetical protein
MSKPKMVLGFVGVFLLGTAATQIAPLVVPPAQAGTSPQKWEYTCKPVPRGGTNVDKEAHDTAAIASELGREGWEMSGGGPRDNGYGIWCFRRALP